MLLKRIYNKKAPADKWVTTRSGCPTCQSKGVVVNAAATGIEKCPDCEKGVRTTRTPPLDHILALHTGVKLNQNFSTRLIDKGVMEGWVTLGNGKITLHTRPENLVYTIYKRPGRYCSHCGEKLQDDATGELSRMHVAANHAGEKSPDPESPAGYAQVNAYLCMLDAAQHAKYRAGRAQ